MVGVHRDSDFRVNVPRAMRNGIRDGFAECLIGNRIMRGSTGAFDRLDAVIALEHRAGTIDLLNDGSSFECCAVGNGVDVFPEPRDVDSGEGVLIGNDERGVVEARLEIEQVERSQNVSVERLHDVLGLELFFERAKRQILLVAGQFLEMHVLASEHEPAQLDVINFYG